MINTLCWNIRGVRRKGTMSHISHLLINHNIDILVLLEPMVDYTNLEQIKNQLKFDHYSHGGDINNKSWVLWKHYMSIDQIVWHPQHITCMALKDNNSIVCSFVYAKCRRRQRIELWDSLINIADNNSTPWLVGGDFNIITMHNEKKGIHPLDVNATMDFNNFIMRAGLSDAGYCGHDYTWCNNRDGDDKVWERLDRFLVNGNYISNFALPKVTHLPRATSDHCPILFESKVNSKNKSRFHYNHMWISHPGFRNIVESSWQINLHSNPLTNFAMKLKHLRGILKKWNWDVFGDQKRRVERLFLEANTLEGILQTSHDDQHERDLKFKKSELENALHLNECLARDKARVSWLKDGSRNTAFFHAMIKARRVQNNITFTREDGTVSIDPNDIGQVAVEY